MPGQKKKETPDNGPSGSGSARISPKLSKLKAENEALKRHTAILTQKLIKLKAKNEALRCQAAYLDSVQKELRAERRRKEAELQNVCTKVLMKRNLWQGSCPENVTCSQKFQESNVQK